MSEWWFVLLAILAVAAVLVILGRGRGASQRVQPIEEHGATRDFVQERDVARRAGFSAEDEAWETASQARNQDSARHKEARATPLSSTEDRSGDPGPGR